MQCALIHLFLKTWQIKVNGELKLAIKNVKRRSIANSLLGKKKIFKKKPMEWLKKKKTILGLEGRGVQWPPFDCA